MLIHSRANVDRALRSLRYKIDPLRREAYRDKYSVAINSLYKRDSRDAAATSSRTSEINLLLRETSIRTLLIVLSRAGSRHPS